MAPRTLNRLHNKNWIRLGDGLHCDGGGLYLQVSASKYGNVRKSWIYKFKLPGKHGREMGLGSCGDLSLAQAREKARECRLLTKEGLDPIEARDAKRAANLAGHSAKFTFDDCAARYISAHEPAWRNDKHRLQWVTTLRDYASPVFGNLPVDGITTEHVLTALQAVWLKKPETASRVRQRVERILAWATVQKYRTGPNPAQWKNHLDHLLPAKIKVARVQHFSAMPYAAAPAFMAQLRERTDIGSKALAFLILTAARTGEVIGARWNEIDLEARTWVIPAERMKASREHRIPLNEPAMAILREMQELRASEFVFPSFDARSRGPLSNMAMSMALRRMGHGDITVHGFRSAFRDWCGEETSFPREICEAALAHTLESKTEAAYRRGDALERRRELMAAWASYCVPAGGNVLPLRRSAATA